MGFLCSDCPNDNGSLHVTLDALNLNKALISTNYLIPKQEDIKAWLLGYDMLSTWGFKSALWQLELHPDSRNFTVFHANNKLFCYTQLVMEVKPTIKTIFWTHTPRVSIRDNLIIICFYLFFLYLKLKNISYIKTV